ncbi:hypothetical protein VNO77_25602 [Canavalia gladiata]|uniref:Uncharacterized protein n=1 Tax=Canavalia gladiata TaxID=3824 RepID=A0AAN9L8Y4_CANGL
MECSTETQGEGWKCIGRDLNCIRLAKERRGRSMSYHASKMNIFNSSIVEMDLEESPSYGRRFTWMNVEVVEDGWKLTNPIG